MSDYDRDFEDDLRAFRRRRALPFGVCAIVGAIFMILATVGFGIASLRDGLIFVDFWTVYVWIVLALAIGLLKMGLAALFGHPDDAEPLFPTDPRDGPL